MFLPTEGFIKQEKLSSKVLNRPPGRTFYRKIKLTLHNCQLSQEVNNKRITRKAAVDDRREPQSGAFTLMTIHWQHEHTGGK